jgi:hypothetical protein
MRPIRFSPICLAAIFLARAFPAAAQLSQSQTDPLARIREASKTNVEACSTTGESLCAQVAPKIIQNAMGESPLAENLRRLTNEIGGRVSGTTAAARAVAWGVAAFRNAGIDAHTEHFASPDGSSPDQDNVIAEIRGREKPDEWVLVGAHLDSSANGPGAVNSHCGATMVLEAARDIFRTGIHPRRSIRFVLFTGSKEGMPGSWAYVRSHRAEMDLARASILLGPGCSRIAGYNLGGRHDIESGIREAMKPVESLGAVNFFFDAGLGTDNYDFLLEGVPALTTVQATISGASNSSLNANTLEKFDIADLKRNTAIAAVTAFGIAERAEPLGPRQSRAEIETLLKSTGLGEQMKIAGLWPLWESGQRGRLP